MNKYEEVNTSLASCTWPALSHPPWSIISPVSFILYVKWLLPLRLVLSPSLSCFFLISYSFIGSLIWLLLFLFLFLIACGLFGVFWFWRMWSEYGCFVCLFSSSFVSIFLLFVLLLFWLVLSFRSSFYLSLCQKYK